jgi:RimJ/RimL family protein N-acetyltransferase
VQVAEIGLSVPGSPAIMPIKLQVAGSGDRSALLLRPWLAADMPALVAEMGREHPTRGLWPTGPRDEQDAVEWLANQDRGWRNGDWLTFAVLEESTASAYRLAGQVGLRNREPRGLVGQEETAEISYWTAVQSRGQGVAPAAVRAVTAWAFDTFSAARMRQIMLVHDVANPASCRVASKAGYALKEFSPANPPFWSTDGHIHVRLAG